MTSTEQSLLVDQVIQKIKTNGSYKDIVSLVNNQRPLGLDFSDIYHFVRAEQQVGGFQYKNVLELGGALSPSFLFDRYDISSWISLESLEYDQNQFSNNYEISSYPSYHYSNSGWKSFYDNWTMQSGRQFDIIYSIAAFEHIYDLPSCLEAAYSMLCPGGMIYSYFTPIWSAPNGAHGFHPDEISIYGDHCHLMFDFTSLVIHLEQSHSFLKSQACAAAHKLYKDSQINRYTYEDFIAIFNSLPFARSIVRPLDQVLFSDLYDSEVLNSLQSFYPSMKTSARGFEVLFQK